MQTVARLKSKAATKQAQSAPAPTPQPGSPRKASDLPSDFFDTPKSKLSKGGEEPGLLDCSCLGLIPDASSAS